MDILNLPITKNVVILLYKIFPWNSLWCTSIEYCYRENGSMENGEGENDKYSLWKK